MTTQVTHVYRCPDHEEFDQGVPFGADVPKWKRCPITQCGRRSPWVPPTVGVVWNTAK